MSIITRNSNGLIKLYCKGADNVIFPRLSSLGEEYKEATSLHLEEFARQGFRTLVLAYKELTEQEYQDWKQKYDVAATSILKRDDKIQQVAELIENDLFILGATAVEDKLQLGVPEAIEKLKIAGINVWVLTGDKLETAVNIGFSCRLLSEEIKLIYLTDDNEELKQNMTKYFQYFSNESQEELASNKFGLIIDGKAIKVILSPQWEEHFFKIATSCSVVICCRATPKNKAEIVELIKSRTDDITLAIGDGANDVSMIQAAHVGIGICGREGNQALAASDYAIGQLWFAIFNGFSGQILFDRWLISLYNVIFTAVPPLAMGLFDRPTKSSTMIRFPQLYSLSLQKNDFNMIVFSISIFNAIIHSAVLFFTTYGVLNTEVAFPDGKIGDYIYLGNYVYTFCVIVVCLKSGLDTESWTLMSFISIAGSIIAWLIFLTIYSYAWPLIDAGEDMVRMVEVVLKSGLFWLALIFVPIFTILPDILYKTIQQTFFKTLFQEVKEAEAKSNENDLEQNSNLFKLMFGNNSPKPLKLIRKLTVPIKYLGFAFSQEENGPVNQADMIVKI